MKHAAVISVSLILVGGCGGLTGSKTATVTGTVVDVNNQPVRDALIKTRFGSTRTSSAGAFTLSLQGTGAVEVTAEAVRNGVKYRGRTTSFNFANDTTRSVNIVVGIESELGRIFGTVTDRNGDVLQDASVYAYNGSGSSIRVFSDTNGDYEFKELVGGTQYTVLAGGQGYRSDSTQINLGLSDSRTANFVLDNPGTPNLAAPQNPFAITWVSPTDATARPGTNLLDLARRLTGKLAKGTRIGKKPKAASTVQVEADLQWDTLQFPDLLGIGVYRGIGDSGPVDAFDFYPDPLAAYYVDQSLPVSSTYSYALTTISALYPDFPDQTESSLSNRIVATTLNLLKLSAPTLTPVTFRWLAGSGADSFTVYLFDEFPGPETAPVWNRTANGSGATSVQYDGPGLNQGQTYYYIVLGSANGGDSRTVSQIGTLTP